MSRKMTVGIDYTSRDYASIKQDMIDMLQEKIPEYTDTSETDAGIVLLECFAMGVDIVSFYLDNQANEAMLSTCEQRKSALNWCNILGYKPKPTTPARVKQVFVLNAPNPVDTTTIPKGTVIKSVPRNGTDKVLYFTTEEDLVLPVGAKGNEKDSNGEYLYQVSAKNGIPIENEILGTSSGSKNQTFLLSYSPVVKDSITIDVLESDLQWARWTEVKDFSDSNLLSRHYVVNILDNGVAQIRFGDGNTGKIPPVYVNGIRASYLSGGGKQGNVTANVLTQMHTSNSLVAETFNPKPVFEEGQDMESLDSIKVNAPNYNRIKWGAFTLEDFEDIIPVLFEDVLFAKATKNAGNIDDVDIYIMLKGNVALTKERIAYMTSILDERKLVGVNEIHIMPMTVYDLDVVCTLIVDESFVKDAVETEVRIKITDYFSVGKFGIGEDVSITDLESSVYEGVAGVRSFRVTNPSDLVISVSDGEVVKLNSVTINSSGGATNGR